MSWIVIKHFLLPPYYTLSDMFLIAYYSEKEAVPQPLFLLHFRYLLCLARLFGTDVSLYRVNKLLINPVDGIFILRTIPRIDDRHFTTLNFKPNAFRIFTI